MSAGRGAGPSGVVVHEASAVSPPGGDGLDGDLAILDPAERDRAGRLRSEIERRRFVMRRALRRRLLAAALGGTADELRIAALCPVCGSDLHGKPYLPDAPSLHFSASRSGDRMVVAIGPTPLGVDVQHAADADLGAAAVFTARESAALASVGEDGDWRRAELWTRKEACLKVIGTGLSIDPASVEAIVVAGEGQFSSVRLPGGRLMMAASWRRGDVVLSLASARPLPVRFETPASAGGSG